jgi:hypothetical protein
MATAVPSSNFEVRVFQFLTKLIPPQEAVNPSPGQTALILWNPKPHDPLHKSNQAKWVLSDFQGFYNTCTESQTRDSPLCKTMLTKWKKSICPGNIRQSEYVTAWRTAVLEKPTIAHLAKKSTALLCSELFMFLSGGGRIQAVAPGTPLAAPRA